MRVTEPGREIFFAKFTDPGLAAGRPASQVGDFFKKSAAEKQIVIVLTFLYAAARGYSNQQQRPTQDPTLTQQPAQARDR